MDTPNPIKTPFTLNIVGTEPVTLGDYLEEDFSEPLSEEERADALATTLSDISAKALHTRYEPNVQDPMNDEFIEARNALLIFCRSVDITADLSMVLNLIGFEPIKINKCENQVFNKHTNDWLRFSSRRLQELLLKDFTDYTLSQLEPTLENPNEFPCKDLLAVLTELKQKGQLVKGVTMFDFEVDQLPTASNAADTPKQQAWFNCIKFDEPEDAEIDI